jgi:hypothetical protein
MAREARAMIYNSPSDPEKLIDIVFTREKLKAFEALVRADERNRTWIQEYWTEYERSIAAAEREQALAEPLQEPVAWVPCLYPGHYITITKPPENWKMIPLYTTPSSEKHPWVGLTDREKLHIEIMGGKSDVMLAEMVEAKLKERNV